MVAVCATPQKARGKAKEAKQEAKQDVEARPQQKAKVAECATPQKRPQKQVPADVRSTAK